MPITAIARFDFSGTLSIADNTTVSRSLTVNNLGGWQDRGHIRHPRWSDAHISH